MPEFHAEPYLHLAGLTHKSALITWGGFYFRVRNHEGDFKLVDDDDLKHVHPPRSETIGARSASYGPALVEVFDRGGTLVSSAETADANHSWVFNLQPDTEYSYRVTVNNEVWGDGERRDWVASGPKRGLVPIGGKYVNRFRTLPSPVAPLDRPFTFAVIGDFGCGVKRPSDDERRQWEVAIALQKAVDEHDVRLILTTGDNIYAQKTILGIPVGSTGDEDDDWFFTFYQPYRYVINRVPVYPSIGNHDSSESEEDDDRGQVFDNFYIVERTAADTGAAGRASIDPGLFYRIRCGADIEFICLDTSKDKRLFAERFFLHTRHARFLQDAFVPPNGSGAPKWRIPFSHHPPYSAGPRHENTREMIEHLVPLFRRASVRVVFSGHEHNFQHSAVDGIDYFVTGGAGKRRRDAIGADNFAKAHTVTWASECHFLLVTIDGDRMTVRAIGELDNDGKLQDIARKTPKGQAATGPIPVALA
jgi:hypothetical protein